MEKIHKCKRCKKPLKTESSIRIGYGPTCAKKEGLVIRKGIAIAKRLDKLK